MSGERDPARVLWVTEEVPDRTGGGGGIRQSHLFEALASAIPTDLLVVGEVADPHVRAAARSITELPPRRALWTDRRLTRRALQLAVAVGSRSPAQAYFVGPRRRTLERVLRGRDREYELVIVEHEALAPLIRSRRHGRWMIELHHLFSEMAEQQVRVAPSARARWLSAWERRRARAFERRLVRSFDSIVTCSQEDAAKLRELAGDGGVAGIAVIPNGVDLGRFPTPGRLPTEPRVLFPGTFGYLPNVDGAVWFCTEVLPRVRAEVPGAVVELAGRSPTSEVIDLGRLDGVEVHPDVPSMAAYFERARVVVVPLRIGTGTRLKALEALAAGRPIVGTTIGLEGIGVVDGEHARVVDDPAAMAEAVIELLCADDRAAALAAAGRAHVEAHYGWERVGAAFVALASELLDGRRRTQITKVR